MRMKDGEDLKFIDASASFSMDRKIKKRYTSFNIKKEKEIPNSLYSYEYTLGHDFHSHFLTLGFHSDLLGVS